MKNKSSSIFILALIILLASASAYFILLFSFKNMRSNLDDLYHSSANSKSRLSGLQKIENNLKITLADKDRLAALFVKQESIVDFIQSIEATMKKLHLSGSIDSVAEENPVELDGTDKEKLNISLSASGDFASLIKLAGLLEKLPYKSTINAMSLTYSKETNPAKISNGDPKSRWGIALQMYALANKPALEKPEAEVGQDQVPIKN